ncbi:unnamed protein product [Caenorhabditis angaria]|uniref:C2H2-type domain-containing protein n=1 Tax=Caenorhabditis angaria TaxID=860376 RepID=A0A9P1I3T1_9PELO|nr:unnamed protein product [Caenorhabditis angaria]
MLVVIDAKDAGEVTEIVTLLLTNKKNTFTVYNDETEMVRKVMKVELPKKSDETLLALKSTPEEVSFEGGEVENHPEENPEEIAALPMEVLYPPSVDKEQEEPAKKPKLDWNFSKALPEIPKSMDDDSAYYIKIAEKEDNYESSEEEECGLVKFEKIEKKKEKKPKKTRAETGKVKLEIPRTVLAPFEKKPKRGRPPKRDTPAVNMPEQDDYDNVVCQKCKNNVRTSSMNLRQLSSHAIVHTDLNRYACPIINCTFKGRQRSVVAYHIAKAHKMESKGVSIPDILTDGEMERLEQCTLECFPNLTFD